MVQMGSMITSKLVHQPTPPARIVFRWTGPMAPGTMWSAPRNYTTSARRSLQWEQIVNIDILKEFFFDNLT